MATQLNQSQLRLNCHKMLKNSRIYQRLAHHSCETPNKNLKNWIDINKKQFLIKTRTHSRSYSLQERSCSPVSRIQIGFPEKKKTSLNKLIVGTRCNSGDTSQSGGSQQKKQVNWSPRKQIGKQGKTTRAILFQIVSHRSEKKEKNEIKGLKGSRFDHIFRRSDFQEDRLAIRGVGIF